MISSKKRLAVVKTLRGYRALVKVTPEQAAHKLGWPLTFYLQAEAGAVNLSAGQQADVRKVLKDAIVKSAQPEVHYAATECGAWAPGDKIAALDRPDLVTCGRCRLTPGHVEAWGRLS